MNRVYNIEFSPTSTIIARQARQKRKKSNSVILKVVRGISYQSKGFFFHLIRRITTWGIPKGGFLRKGAPVPPREGYLKGGQHPAPLGYGTNQNTVIKWKSQPTMYCWGRAQC